MKTMKNNMKSENLSSILSFWTKIQLTGLIFVFIFGMSTQLSAQSKLQESPGGYHGELDFPQKAKIHRKLTNRGFNHEQANIALARVLSGD